MGKAGYGVSSAVVGYCNALITAGCEVILAAELDGGKLPSLSCDVKTIRLRRGLRGIYDLNTALKRTNPDILHQHGLWNCRSICVSMLASFYNVKYVLSPHGMLNNQSLTDRKWSKKLAWSIFESRTVANASALFCLTDREVEEVSTIDYSRRECFVVPNVITPQYFISKGRSADNELLLLYLGRLTPLKNVDGLIKAIAVLVGHHKISNIKLQIAGAGSDGYTRYLKHLVSRLDLQNWVTFLGYLGPEDKNKRLSEVDFLVLPSLNEALPMVVLEAWSVGLPCLVTEHCNVGYGIDLGAGMTIRVTPESMARDMIDAATLAQDSAASMRAASLAVIEKFHTPTIVGRRLNDLYAKVLG